MATSLDAAPSTIASRRPRLIARVLPAIPRVLMGAQFLFGGLFGLLMHPTPPPGLPAGAIAFNDALANSGYMMQLLCVTQALAGALLLANRFVPLGIALLAPIIVNIFAFHVFLEPSGRPVAVVVAALEIYLAWQYREAFRPMLAARVPRSGALRS